MRNFHWSTRVMALCGLIYICWLMILFGGWSYKCMETAWMMPSPDVTPIHALNDILYGGAAMLIALVLTGIVGWRWRAIGIMLLLLFAALVLTLLGMAVVPPLTHAVLFEITGKQCPLHSIPLPGVR